MDRSGLHELPKDAGADGVLGTGGITGSGTGGRSTNGSGGSSTSSSGGAGAASGGSGGAATSTGGSGGAGPNATGGTTVDPSSGSGGATMSGAGGSSGSGGVTASGGAGGMKAPGGARGMGGAGASGGVTATGGVGNAGGAPTSGGGHAGGPGGPGSGGISPFLCNAVSCADGCCEGNLCVTFRTVDRCGKGGAACAACGKCSRCASGACELDPASMWRLVCSSAVITATQPNGDPWDPPQGGGPGPGGPGGGPSAEEALPDPICQLSIGLGGADAATSIQMNTLKPTWNESITPSPTTLTAARLMSQAMPWSITVSDDDDRMASDLICRVTPQLTPADFAAADVTFPPTQGCTSLSLHLICIGG